jgi:hypothetical protein
MSLTQYGIQIACEHCQCARSDGHGGFEVTVPLSDGETGGVGTATLHCRVVAAHHRVELRDWRDGGQRPVAVDTSARRRLAAALGFVAEHRICGNRHICPADVVRIVAEHGAH